MKGTPAWYYRAHAGVVPGSYRFGALARTREQLLSTAITTVGSDTVWVRIS
jgi:hypothetical protein